MHEIENIQQSDVRRQERTVPTSERVARAQEMRVSECEREMSSERERPNSYLAWINAGVLAFARALEPVSNYTRRAAPRRPHCK